MISLQNVLSISTRTLGFLFLVQSSIGLKVWYTKDDFQTSFNVFCHCYHACLFGGIFKVVLFWRSMVFAINIEGWLCLYHWQCLLLVMSYLLITLIKCLNGQKYQKLFWKCVFWKRVCTHVTGLVTILEFQVERYQAALRHAGYAKIKIGFLCLPLFMICCSIPYSAHPAIVINGESSNVKPMIRVRRSFYFRNCFIAVFKFS